MTLRLTDRQTAALRARADKEGRSMQQVALTALDDYLLRSADDEETIVSPNRRIAVRRPASQTRRVTRGSPSSRRSGSRALPWAGRYTCVMSACWRPRSTGRANVLGQDAYPELMPKAAALLHLLARNHPLVDGNKRLAWLATYAAYDLVVAVAAGTIDDVDEIAAALACFVR